MLKFNQYSATNGGAYGSTLSPKEISGQLLLMEGCLSAGITFAALDNLNMKEAFRHFGVKLPSAIYLKNHTPFVLEEEVKYRHVRRASDLRGEKEHQITGSTKITFRLTQR